MEDEDILSSIIGMGPPELTPEEVWITAWTAVAQHPGCGSTDVATNWADKCLFDFNSRFRVDEPEKSKEAEWLN
jgi:hypothetical protein